MERSRGARPGPTSGFELVHLGFVVDQLDRVMVESAVRWGVRWRSPTRAVRHLRLDGVGPVDLELTSVHSAGRRPRLELVGAVPGTLWVPPADGRVHHVAFATPSASEGHQRLVEAGLRQVVSDQPDGPTFEHFAYYRGAAGPFVELLARPSLRTPGTTS